MKVLFVYLVSALLALSSVQAATLINGAGATFPYPIYSKWFSEFQKVEVEAQFNYQSIGSGGGIRQFLEKTVDFGASDAPMTDEQLAKATGPVIHIPTVMGAVVMTYNLPGVGKGLKLSAEVLTDIFLGKVKQWNDPRIVAMNAMNPSIKFPSDPILVVHRSDGSGTTAIFVDYLSKVSPEWKEKVGAGTSVNWPAGLGGKGNEGVTGLVKQTPGSIGYVELIYAENNHLPYALIKNASGHFVEPSMKSVSQAAVGVKIPDDFRVSITNPTSPESKEAYPIAGFTYLLISKNLPGLKGKEIVKFLHWAIKEGQKYAEPLYYAPLPKSLLPKVESKINTIQLD